MGIEPFLGAPDMLLHERTVGQHRTHELLVDVPVRVMHEEVFLVPKIVTQHRLHHVVVELIDGIQAPNEVEEVIHVFGRW